MKIFKSLNCEVCKAPFAPVANQPQSPMALLCGKAMCHGCFEMEKSTKKEERKHQCEYSFCFSNPNFAYSLIDVLSQDSLKLSPMGDGYVLCKPFKIPECPVCYEKYSINIEGKSSFRIWCNHTICTECYLKTRILYEKSDTDGSKYEVKCPVCQEGTVTNVTNERKDRLQDFLAELPEMTLQLEEMDTAAYRFCEECKRESPIEDLFHCAECEQNICARCGLKDHRPHKPIEILKMEATKLSDRLQKCSINVINRTKSLFPELHKELLDDLETFGTRLLLKEKNLKRASNYEDLQKKLDKYTQLNTKFEDTSTLYNVYLQQYNAKIKELIKSLDDNTN